MEWRQSVFVRRQDLLVRKIGARKIGGEDWRKIGAEDWRKIGAEDWRKIGAEDWGHTNGFKSKLSSQNGKAAGLRVVAG